ncbi:MAG: methyltransferase domain-containing protein [Chloroflexota bacterium]
MDHFKHRFANNPGLVEKTIASYDQHADAFLKKHGDFEPIEALLEFQRFVMPGSRVLDAGCGLGRDTDYLRKHGYPQSIGLDMSFGMLNMGARSANFQFPAVQADFRALPLAAQSFDGVWAVASIIHIPRGNVENVLKEFKRILKPGGFVYLSVIKGSGEEAESGEEDVVQRGWRYFVFYELDEMKTLLQKAGLKSIVSWDRPGKSPTTKKEFKKRDWIHLIAKS